MAGVSTLNKHGLDPDHLEITSPGPALAGPFFRRYPSHSKAGPPLILKGPPRNRVTMPIAKERLMKAANDSRGYGWVTRFFHWIIAALIFATIALGLYADSLRASPPEQVAQIFQVFSVHKTVGILVLILAVFRIIWTLTQPKPRPLHPDRKLETWLGEMVHFGLWFGMLVIPLSGWLLHSAAPGGFARILWPFGQRLPFVPEDLLLSERFARFHDLGWWLLGALIALHVAGALKHAVIDRDATLARMAGRAANLPEPPASEHHRAASAPLVAVLIWLALGVFSVAVPPKLEADAIEKAAVETSQPAAPATTESTAPAATPTAPASANAWAVQSGNLAIAVTQAGSEVSGAFADWQAQIDYDPAQQSGNVVVDIDIASLTLGAISDNAKGPDFLNAAQFPKAQFKGDITADPAGGSAHLAKGELTIAGKTMPATLNFDLTITGDEASAKGGLSIDRRDYEIGKSYADESTVSFPVTVTFDLIAKRP